jgi:hypothetical protein
VSWFVSADATTSSFNYGKTFVLSSLDMKPKGVPGVPLRGMLKGGGLAAAHKGEAFIRLVSAATKLSIDELAVSPPTQGLHFERSDTGS